jgi:hypothetical protein
MVSYIFVGIAAVAGVLYFLRRSARMKSDED